MGQALRTGIEADHDQPEYAEALEFRQLSKLRNALHLHIPEIEREFERERNSARARDVDTAVELIRQASSSNVLLDERSRDLEAKLDALTDRSAQELAISEARAHAAETRAQAADARTLMAEQRLGEAEERLRQIIDVIGEELSGRPAAA